MSSLTLDLIINHVEYIACSRCINNNNIYVQMYKKYISWPSSISFLQVMKRLLAHSLD